MKRYLAELPCVFLGVIVGILFGTILERQWHRCSYYINVEHFLGDSFAPNATDIYRTNNWITNFYTNSPEVWTNILIIGTNPALSDVDALKGEGR